MGISRPDLGTGPSCRQRGTAHDHSRLSRPRPRGNEGGPRPAGPSLGPSDAIPFVLPKKDYATIGFTAERGVIDMLEWSDSGAVPPRHHHCVAGLLLDYSPKSIARQDELVSAGNPMLPEPSSRPHGNGAQRESVTLVKLTLPSTRASVNSWQGAGGSGAWHWVPLHLMFAGWIICNNPPPAHHNE